MKYLVTFIFSLSLITPGIVREPDSEYHRLVKFYPKMKTEWFHLLYSECKKRNVSIDVACAIIQSESNWSPKAKSCASARGLFQIMPFHAHSYGITPKDLYNPSYNIKIGIKYWAWCKKYSKGNIKKAIMCYNAGPYANHAKYKNWGYLNTICYNSYKTSNTNQEDINIQ